MMLWDSLCILFLFPFVLYPGFEVLGFAFFIMVLGVLYYSFAYWFVLRFYPVYTSRTWKTVHIT
ncbi:hypothetical protein P280DRAFT_21060 [Massarina eburnea CBS 473.64]|uniref:Uncharacterized protein n=1 Tax=Massarina eburnea CBS 473.64 TaxID=1395130 RepID=A0A6A6SKJ5_9PLEO|nr:hypothetical protein P280DRAFT_21060 [Massarina eburnea CBS 473.64]